MKNSHIHAAHCRCSRCQPVGPGVSQRRRAFIALGAAVACALTFAVIMNRIAGWLAGAAQ